MPKRRLYSQDELEAAISCVKRTKLPISQVSRDFGIPRKTLADRLNGRYTTTINGPAPILTDEEEKALVSYMKYLAQQGFPMTREMVRKYIISIYRTNGRNPSFNMETGPSNKWFKKFLKRNPDINERKPEGQDRSRHRMSNPQVMDQYFDLLTSEVNRLSLNGNPDRIFNCDETGWTGKERSQIKVFASKGSHSYQQAVSSAGHITAHMCVAADGRVLPTFVIYQRCLPHTAYKDGVPGNWMYGSSESGYMDSDLFITWFRDLFIPNCGSKRPVLLVMDNHDTHINLNVVKLAMENNVTLLGLPPHTTHILQPLDVGIMGPLKGKFLQIANNLGFIGKHQVLNKAKFPVVLSYSIDQSLTLARVKYAFRRSGLYPVDRHAIDESQLVKSHLKKSEGTIIPGSRSATLPVTSTESPLDNSSVSDSPDPTTSSAILSAPTMSSPQPGPSRSSETHLDPSSSLSEGASNPVSKHQKCTGQTCPTCGSFLGGNPLVQEGLIPENLADIFTPVPCKPQPACRRKLVTVARVLTNADFCQKLQEKHDETIKRKEEIEKRKKEREEKKNTKSVKKTATKGAKTTQKKVQAVKEVESDVCQKCFQEETSGDDDVDWIECDTCGKWYHLECVGLDPLSIDQADETFFVCESCC